MRIERTKNATRNIVFGSFMKAWLDLQDGVRRRTAPVL